MPYNRLNMIYHYSKSIQIQFTTYFKMSWTVKALWGGFSMGLVTKTFWKELLSICFCYYLLPYKYTAFEHMWCTPVMLLPYIYICQKLSTLSGYAYTIYQQDYVFNFKTINELKHMLVFSFLSFTMASIIFKMISWTNLLKHKFLIDQWKLYSSGSLQDLGGVKYCQQVELFAIETSPKRCI